MHEIQRRVNATQATEKRLRDRPFDWSKSATCIHLMRFHAAQLGYDMPIVPRFRTALSARKALKKMGFETLPELMDSMFERIPSAFMRVGDMLALPGDGGFHSLVIKGDKTKFLGWHEDDRGCTIIDIHRIDLAEGAWRL